MREHAFLVVVGITAWVFIGSCGPGVGAPAPAPMRPRPDPGSSSCFDFCFSSSSSSSTTGGWTTSSSTSSTGGVTTIEERPPVTSANLHAVNGRFAVGAAGTILRRDDTTWSVDESPAQVDLWAVGEDASNGVALAVGAQGTILRFYGQWRTMVSPTTETLNAVWVRDAGEAWAVGGTAGGPGVILRFNGVEWFDVTPQDGVPALFAVAGFSTTLKVWAFGENGVGVHYDGFGWSTTSITSATLLAAWPVENWVMMTAGFDTNILLRLNASWSHEYGGTGIVLLGLAGRHTSALYAVGERGTVLKRAEGGGWTALVSSTERTLYDAYEDAAGNLWIVGEAGTILRGH